MKEKQIEQGLTRGLIAGYGGESKFLAVNRGGFQLQSSHLEEKNLKYHDEWLQARIGGGQELIEVAGQRFTRLYAGGIIDEIALKKLEVTQKDIIDFLKHAITILKQKTRLFDDCQFNDQEQWSYTYQVLDRDQNLAITTAKEAITYKNTIVFVHNFLLCPVIE